MWAACVGEALGPTLRPRHWLLAGVGEDVAELPAALVAEVHERTGIEIYVAPLRVTDATRLASDMALRPEDLIAAAAADLASAEAKP